MLVPQKLKNGDEIRVVALARSLSLVGEKNAKLAQEKLEKEGFVVTFGKHCWEKDEFCSSSVESRIQDLHEAFSDKNVKAVLTVIGGYNTNQLLRYIDYDLIRNNPKILCWFSDITAIGNAITAKTGMITYSGVHFSTWAMELGFDYNREYFQKCLMQEDAFEVGHSETWSDDPWYLDQLARDFIPGPDYWIMNEGEANGRIVWGHVRCLACLQWTEYMPSLKDVVLFLEEDAETNPQLFDRLLQSLIHQPDFDWVRGVVIGRFQKASNATRELLAKIIRSKKELAHIPIIANADFGHTNPLITFPVGWNVEIKAFGNRATISITKH